MIGHLYRTRFMGLAKNATVYGFAAMAANIRKGARFLANIRKGARFLMRYGLPDPGLAG